ncbi:MAG: CoA-binding protein [Victivallaceae bacterium]|nr:CoA-binding protein [Victivallaceae bacterium]
MAVKNKTVAVLGASHKPERYSNKAVRSLSRSGYEVIPVNPAGGIICELPVAKRLDEIKIPVDTLSIYVNAQLSSSLNAAILRLKPERVIFNPGTENPELEKALTDAGIRVIHACTLVLLETGQFETARC